MCHEDSFGKTQTESSAGKQLVVQQQLVLQAVNARETAVRARPALRWSDGDESQTDEL